MFDKNDPLLVDSGILGYRLKHVPSSESRLPGGVSYWEPIDPEEIAAAEKDRLARADRLTRAVESLARAIESNPQLGDPPPASQSQRKKSEEGASLPAANTGKRRGPHKKTITIHAEATLRANATCNFETFMDHMNTNFQPEDENFVGYREMCVDEKGEKDLRNAFRRAKETNKSEGNLNIDCENSF
jgi:hypothetical protein